MNQLEFGSILPFIVYEDNLPCVKMVYGNLNFNTTKHINVRYHFTKDQVNEGKVKIIHCQEMVADVLTKPLAANQHSYLSLRLLNHSVLFLWRKRTRDREKYMRVNM